MGLISGIINHRKTEDVIPSDQLKTEVNRNAKRVITTKGLNIQIKWTDGTWVWLPLKDVKAAVSLKLTEYAVSFLGGFQTPSVRGKE